MKKLATLIIIFAGVIGYSQDIEPTFEAEGNLVKATYYYEDGSISTQGYFLDKALTWSYEYLC